jgi:hypothetical protein
MKSTTKSLFLRFVFSLICLIIIFRTSFSISSKLSLKTRDINQCRNFNYNKANFTIDKLLGVWYPVKKSDNLPIIDDCDKITIKNATNITVELESFKRLNPFRDSPRELKTLELSPTKNLNSFRLSIMGIDNVFTVVDTDYKNWALILLCSERDNNIRYNAILLSRNYELEERKQYDIERYSVKVLGVELDDDVDQGPFKCLMPPI